MSSRRQHTRDLLIDAATALFAEKSIEGASVEEICERAGFTRGAFYSNFESKEDLCLEIVRQRGEQLLETTRRALGMIPDAPVSAALLEEIIARVVAVLDIGITLDDNWVLVRAELRLYAFRHPSFRPALVQIEGNAIQLSIADLAQALERHGARLLIPIDQLLFTLDAYCERTRLDAILTGQPDSDHAWRAGMERLVRAVVVLPDDSAPALAGAG
ncbi:TetR/AcrR family transcriptional regulator [Propionicimonas sp.]|uniref:TetR/AcrR family transcriptional regulator n=1 Tax=Propionicimonas sp. TaxID=1955623 RepID=UPI0039E2DA46